MSDQSEILRASELLARLGVELSECASGGRSVVVVVSKTRSAEEILPFLKAGARDFGENYAQEITEKWPPLLAMFPDVRLHFIGPFQRSKIPAVTEYCAVIHSVDNIPLAEALGRRLSKEEKRPEILLQVNIGREPQKRGVTPEALPALAERAVSCGLNVRGLMCVPPAGEAAGPYFAELARLAGEQGLPKLSMGMTEDYREAAQAGATYVRIGSALFGPRKPGALSL